MDEDSRLIEELRANIASQRAHILKLDKALKQEIAKNEEGQRTKSDELRQANEVINGLKQKIANYGNILESRNAELQNLQTALGQYYAEAEAKVSVSVAFPLGSAKALPVDLIGRSSFHPNCRNGSKEMWLLHEGNRPGSRSS